MTPEQVQLWIAALLTGWFFFWCARAGWKDGDPPESGE